MKREKKMKNIIEISILIAFILSFNSVFAQDRNASLGPIPIMNGKSSHNIIQQIDNPASIGYGWEWISKSTLSMPIPAGSPFTTLNIFLPPNGGFASSMTKGGDGNYYVITYDNPSLYLFNTATGAVTLVGSITGLTEEPTGISYNPVNGNYYIITTSNLYSFNISTRVATLIGSMGIPSGGFIDLCFTEGGACYSYSVATDAAYIINPQTGAATYLGSIGFQASYGQDMGYDMETGTIYLSAYNVSPIGGQLRTMDPGTGATTVLTDWGNQQVAMFELNTQYGPPCSIGMPSNPNPPNGATNVPITGTVATWTNGSGTTNNEVWFGSVGNVAKVYDGAAITSFALPTLIYDTKYLWWVVSKNSTCKTQGLPWSFTTQRDPNQVVAFYDPVNDLNCWTAIGPVGQSNWLLSNTNLAGGSPPSELLLWYDPTFNGLSRIMSCPINSSSSYQNNITWRQYAEYYLGVGPFIGLAVSYDGGATSTILWETQITADILPEEKTLAFTPSSNTYQLIFYLNGNSFNINLWTIDDVQVDYTVPVELVSFSANVNENLVELNWITSTETNNRGFEVQRSNGSEFETIAFVEGSGTTTEFHTYSFSDRNLNPGKYNYRLKQIDFDGTFNYSNVIEVEVITLNDFTLEQNYPNPFNPSTTINFSLPEVSEVSLTIFNTLGQKVTELVNGKLEAGKYSYQWNAGDAVTGLYIYELRTEKFVSVKKMILLK
jgi:hypothetical protein